MTSLTERFQRTDETPDTPPGVALVLGLGLILLLAQDAVQRWVSDLEISHRRAELLRAYRSRHRWKASDRARLETLPLNPVARRLLGKLRGRGRPLVSPYRELADVMAERLEPFAVIASDRAAGHERRRALKALPWWPHFVESVYRGERDRLKAAGEPNPSQTAEIGVGRELGVSASTVHRLCGHIRRLRTARPEDANFNPVTLADLRAWLEGRGADPWG